MNQILKRIDFENYDTIALFGAVTNGLIEPSQRARAWLNIEKMMSSSTFLIVHSLGDRRWYESEPLGKCLRLVTNDVFPNQYLYSKSELEAIFKQHNLRVISSYNLDLPSVTLKHSFFVLRKTT